MKAKQKQKMREDLANIRLALWSIHYAIVAQEDKDDVLNRMDNRVDTMLKKLEELQWMAYDIKEEA